MGYTYFFHGTKIRGLCVATLLGLHTGKICTFQPPIVCMKSLNLSSPHRLDAVNIALMVVSLGLAYVLPFELFLFSYAVLGPLHYLTEISWLHQKNYFVGGGGKGNRWFALIALVLGACITLANFGDTLWDWLFHSPMPIRFPEFGTHFIFLAFGAAFVFVLMQGKWQRVLGVAALFLFAVIYPLDQSQTTLINHEGVELGGVYVKPTDKYLAITDITLEMQNGEKQSNVALLLKRQGPGQWDYVDNPLRSMNDLVLPSHTATLSVSGALLSVMDGKGFQFGVAHAATGLFFSFFLPTLIHVFLFTGLFMWFGALKSGSTLGLISVACLFVCGALPFFWDPGVGSYVVSEAARNSYDVSFYDLNVQILRLFDRMGAVGEAQTLVYSSAFGVSVTRFIAFAYTYHYLNWFSKTNIIQWHKVPMLNLSVVVLLWLASVGLYVWDYQTGLQALFFLSFLHVFMEFPLNVQSLLGISKHYLGRLGKREAATA